MDSAESRQEGVIVGVDINQNLDMAMSDMTMEDLSMSVVPGVATSNTNETLEIQQILDTTTNCCQKTIEWLLNNYEVSEDSTVLRATMYVDYLQHCLENNLRQMADNCFGKIVRSVFPKVGTRRLGPRGNSQYHYNKLRLKSGSPPIHLSNYECDIPVHVIIKTENMDEDHGDDNDRHIHRNQENFAQIRVDELCMDKCTICFLPAAKSNLDCSKVLFVIRECLGLPTFLNQEKMQLTFCPEHLKLVQHLWQLKEEIGALKERLTSDMVHNLNNREEELKEQKNRARARGLRTLRLIARAFLLPAKVNLSRCDDNLDDTDTSGDKRSRRDTSTSNLKDRELTARTSEPVATVQIKNEPEPIDVAQYPVVGFENYEEGTNLGEELDQLDLSIVDQDQVEDINMKGNNERGSLDDHPVDSPPWMDFNDNCSTSGSEFELKLSNRKKKIRIRKRKRSYSYSKSKAPISVKLQPGANDTLNKKVGRPRKHNPLLSPKPKLVRQFKCHLCATMFNSMQERWDHFKSGAHPNTTQIAKKGFPCPVKLCGKEYSSSRSLNHHVRLYHSHRSPFQCDVCKKEFILEAGLRDHIRRIHPPESSIPLIPCSQCGQEVSGKKALLAHLREVHNNNVKIYKCGTCPKKFISKTNWTRHKQNVHIKNHVPVPCNLCGKKFSSKRTLRIHEESMHIRSKPMHQCPICGFLKMYESQLKIHVASCVRKKNEKTTEERRTCQYCGKKYATLVPLKIHVAKVHLKNLEKKVCEWCGRSFGNNSSLRFHQFNKHQDKFTFSCEYCEMKFMYETDVQKHYRSCQKRRIHDLHERKILTSNIE